MSEVITIITTVLSLGGALAGTIAYIVKLRKDNKIQKEAEEKQIELKLKAEKETFYLTTAANLVVSAEKLTLTGVQKKEYVMTWLENEAIKAGIVVDKALMSVVIERTIAVLNEHKSTPEAIAQLKISLDEQVAIEQAKIDAEKETKLEENEQSFNDSIKLTGEINAKVNEVIDEFDVDELAK